MRRAARPPGPLRSPASLQRRSAAALRPAARPLGAPAGPAPWGRTARRPAAPGSRTSAGDRRAKRVRPGGAARSESIRLTKRHPCREGSPQGLTLVPKHAAKAGLLAEVLLDPEEL